MLLKQDGDDERDDGGSFAREDADDHRASLDLAIDALRPFGVVGRDEVHGSADLDRGVMRDQHEARSISTARPARSLA